jgi:hypothetical protein
LSQSFDTADLSLDTAQRETEEFLTLQLPSTLSAVEYEMPLFSEEANRQTLGHGSAVRGPDNRLARHGGPARSRAALGGNLLLRQP